MYIIDTHCDALLKLQTDFRNTYLYKDRSLDYLNSPELDTNMNRRIEGKVKVQFYAIFISPLLPDNEKWQHALEQIDRFHKDILTQKHMVHIKNLKEINNLKENEYGAVLTLEGSDAFGNDLVKLRTLFRLGVLSLGLVWNNGNLVGDGVGETRNAGLSEFGKSVIEECNAHDVLIDVSHLNEAGVKDVIKYADKVIATHSNARAIMDHPRNLYDEQIKAIIDKGGMVNIVFCPPFIAEGTATYDDLFKHIDHLVKLGAENHIGLGSDFDGITEYVEGLQHAGHYQTFVNALIERYGEAFTKRLTHDNFLERFC